MPGGKLIRSQDVLVGAGDGGRVAWILSLAASSDPRGHVDVSNGVRENLVEDMTPAGPIGPELLTRLRQRDPEALAQAVRDHARTLFRAARGLGFADPEAEDLVQDVFTTFLERLDSFEGRSHLRTWLFGILHRKALERRRASVIDERTDPIDEIFESRFDEKGKWSRPPADLERLFLSKELGELIRGCMDGLPVNQREAFVLREVEGFETDEICKILDVSVTNMGVLIHRARARLRECLESKGWTRS